MMINDHMISYGKYITITSPYTLMTDMYVTMMIKIAILNSHLRILKIGGTYQDLPCIRPMFQA